MPKNVSQLIKEYETKYGNIPDTQEERLSYIQKKYKLKHEKILSAIEEVNSIGWKHLDITIPLVPTPSPRPRYSFKTKHFYVSGAGSMHSYMDKLLEESDIVVEYTIPDPEEFSNFIQAVTEEIGIICTQTIFGLTTFQPIPLSSMNGMEIYLAEMGIVRPVQNPDWDNLGKTYSDMIQGRLLLNDNLITDGGVHKYFSIKPRIHIEITYQDGYDCRFNKNKIINSTSYLKYLESFGIEMK